MLAPAAVRLLPAAGLHGEVRGEGEQGMREKI